jgi:hypothetical protein
MGAILKDFSMTPICNNCGICLCWDISEFEYLSEKEFWDAWICQECNNGIKFTRKLFKEGEA